MNSTRKLQFFVGRLFSVKCCHQSESFKFVIRSAKSPHRSNDVFVKICRGISTDMKSQCKEEQLHKSGKIELSVNKNFVSKLPSQERYGHALMKALDCDKEDLKEIQEENIFWRNFPIDAVIKRIEAYNKLGVQQSDLVEHSSSLYIDFEYFFDLLRTLCTVLDYNGHDLFPLLLLPKKTIHSYVENCTRDCAILGSHVNRIRYLSTKLQVPARTITENMKDHPFLLQLPIRKITEMMDFLLDGGIAKEDVFNDLWIFKCGVARIRLRLNYCQEAGISNIKPWHLRATHQRFLRSVEIKKTAQSTGKGLSWTEFVAQSLNLPEEEVKAMVKYHKLIEKVNFPKTKDVIDFLLSEGFVPEQILLSPQVFTTSIYRLKRRMNILKEAGIDPVQHWEFLRRMRYSETEFMSTIKNNRKYVKDNICVQDVS